MVFPDISTDQGCIGSGWQSFEDWYVHPDLVDMNFVNIITKNNIETRNDYLRSRIKTSFRNYINLKKPKSDNKMKVIFSK